MRGTSGSGKLALGNLFVAIQNSKCNEQSLASLSLLGAFVEINRSRAHEAIVDEEEVGRDLGLAPVDSRARNVSSHNVKSASAMSC